MPNAEKIIEALSSQTTEQSDDTIARQIEPSNSSPEDLIAQRAYEKWQQRGCPIGDDLHDWFAAQAEIELEAEARLGMEEADIERVAC